MKSSPDEHGTHNPDHPSIRDLCAQARQDRRFGVLLEACLADQVTSRVLLLHRTELFPRLEVPIEGSMVTIAAGGLPFLSDAPKYIRRSLKLLAAKYAAHSPHPERIAEAQQRVESVETALAESVRDAFALAVLNTVSANAPLRDLVNGPRPIERAHLRRAVKDYSGIDWSPAISLVGEAVSALWQADRSRKPVKQLLFHLDALKDVIDLERFKAQIVEWLVTHFQRLLQIRGVNHEDWAGVVLRLHQDAFLEHAGPLRDHLLVAKGQGMKVSYAACVVNLTRQQLVPLIKAGAGRRCRIRSRWRPNPQLRRCSHLVEQYLSMIGQF